ncbi:CPBP family intramembrane glutamic endopeptidase [Sphingobacterium psychroaquaticum]|uniref:CPBP family intramembrane glutamic endopeptidase n=1 Tax=Sphingobacterium psychroaquaticum TaxID=561061 RepID=UPI0019CFA61D|nr:CPBP family intramembrane glutamic endopeptidase [Sphingobacterium psychroaquaticum]
MVFLFEIELNMLGLCIILILSALLLWILKRKSLTILGLKPNQARSRDFLIGFCLSILLCTFYHLLKAGIAKNTWLWNPELDTIAVGNGILWVVKSVLFEELLFRGVLLFLVIEYMGWRKGCFISAMMFGVYHWFSYGVLGFPMQMLLVFISTGLIGWVLAFAYAKTGTLWLPISLHLGWNLCHIILFSNGPLGAMILTPANANKPEGIPSLLLFIFQLLALPAAAFLYVKWRTTKTKL